MFFRVLVLVIFLVVSFVSFVDQAHANGFQLTWADNSTNEDGFIIERKTGTSGIFARIASVGANVTSYADAGLADATTYCYRVNAFNSAGNSPSAPEVCGTTPMGTTLPPAAQQFTLTIGLVKTVTSSGTGNGTVTSSPAGINCGGTCSASFSSGTRVTLTATPAVGSTFGGWSGTSCSSGVTTMNVARTCTATFNPQPVQPNSILSITKKGTGSGTVTSSPSGINCGSTCSASFANRTLTTLTATPVAGSTFAGWSGTGCSTGKIMMDVARTCSATFNSESSQTKFSLSLTKKGTGSGSVMSTPAGINCGPNCSALFDSGAVVTLKATAGADSRFTGWSGQGCRTGTVTMSVSINCTANFQSRSTHVKTKFGVFRPDTGEWFLDNGNGQWDGCDIDNCVKSFGQTGDLPVVGSWSGNGLSNIGTFTPRTGTWRLDTNGDGVLDCRVDTCADSLGQAGDFPIIREQSDGNESIIGTFTPQRLTKVKQRKVVKRGRWNFDVNGNSELDGCEVDECTIFRSVGELPVVGDWDGTGTQEIGVFLPRRGSWHLDRNGNGKWDGCEKDKCFRHFGTEGDLPVVGDWDGAGSVRIGVFRPSTGMWYLDINANGKMDSCAVDACFGPFGQLGDLPVVGKW
jgi:hypothetical protein